MPRHEPIASGREPHPERSRIGDEPAQPGAHENLQPCGSCGTAFNTLAGGIGHGLRRAPAHGGRPGSPPIGGKPRDRAVCATSDKPPKAVSMSVAGAGERTETETETMEWAWGRGLHGAA